jgi:hypothetical protein
MLAPVGLRPVADKEVTVSRRAWNLPVVVALLAICIGAPAYPQGNIDAGKTPAQIFSSTCTACHRRPQELKRSSASFLRQHYTTGSEEASAMASYLAGVGSDPRAVEQRGKDRGKGLEKQAPGKATPGQQQAQSPGQPQTKGRQPAKSANIAARQPDPQPEMPEPVANAPVLEPFEE